MTTPTLKKHADAMAGALEAFADCCEFIGEDEDDEEWAKFRLLVKDYRRARQALANYRAEVE